MLKPEFVPIPGREDISLTAALNEALAQSPALRNAIDLIGAVERNAPLPNDTSDADRQRAAELLLSLLQPGLLLQLARQLPHPYHLAIGASPERARVLTEIGKAWPEHPTSIGLCSSLPTASLNGLQAFLKRPTELSVDLEMDESDATDDLKPLAEALKRKDLVTWTLRCPDDINAAGLDQLIGVRAQSLVIDYTEAEGDTDEPLRTAFISLVRQSAASSVDLSNYGLCNEPLEYGLLETPDTWHRITLPYQGLVALPSNTVTTTLEICDNGYLALDANFLQLFENDQFTHLVTDSMVDLKQAIALGNAGWWIESIDACFFVEDGDDIEAMLANWTGTGLQALQHRPQTGRSMDGYTQISADLAARLAARSQSNRLAAEADPASQAFLKDERAVLIKNVIELHRMLDPEATVDDVLAHLQSDDYRELNPQPSEIELMSYRKHAWTPFAKKIWCMLDKGAPLQAIEVVIATFLRHNPHLAMQACQDLIALDYPLRSRSPQEWENQAANWATRWSSAQLTLAGVNKQEVLKRIAIPKLAAPPAPTPTPTPNAPTTQRKAAELVTPPGQDSATNLLVKMLALQRQQIGAPNSNLNRQMGINFIMMRLQDVPTNIAAETDGVRAEIANILLGEGQGPLLNELLPFAPDWFLPVRTASAARFVESQGLWKNPDTSFHVALSSALSNERIESVKHFLKSVTRDKLKLTIELQAGIDTSALLALVGLVESLPGCTLMLKRVGANDVPADELLPLLQRIRDVPLRAFGLSGMKGDGALAQAFKETFQRSGTSDLTLIQGSEALASTDLLSGQPFQRITISATRAVAELFESSGVNVQELQLLMTGETVEDDDGMEVEDTRCVSTIVSSCKHLEKVRVLAGRTDALTFVKTLRAQQSTYDVQSALTTDIPNEEHNALTLLRRNTSIINLQLKARPRPLRDGQRDLSLRTIEAMQKVATRNRFMFRLGVGTGAGKGFGWQQGKFYGTDAVIDVGGKIGDMLDLRSALALSRTSKAAYLGARQPWEAEIRKLAHLLDPDVRYEKLIKHLALLIELKILPGPLPTSLLTTGPEGPYDLSYKLLALDAAGMPPEAIGQAVGLRLPLYMAEQPESIPYVLRLLAFVGAMPPLAWLCEGMDIHVLGYSSEPADTDIHLILRRHPIPE